MNEAAKTALERLKAGNVRFAKGEPTSRPPSDAKRRAQLEGQAPYAAILACADSRVPVESLFDCEPGEIFVVRVAGNVVTPTQRGSLEYAVEVLETPLVIVMGHTRCGAIQAALDHMARQPHAPVLSDGLRSIIEPISEAVEWPSRALRDAVRANVCASVKKLTDLDAEVLAADYALETGLVTFFDRAEDDA